MASYDFKPLGTLTYKNTNDKFYWLHRRLSEIENGLDGDGGLPTFQTVTFNGNSTTQNFFLKDADDSELISFVNESGFGTMALNNPSLGALLWWTPEEISFQNQYGYSGTMRWDDLDNDFVWQLPAADGTFVVSVNGIEPGPDGNILLNTDSSGSYLVSGGRVTWKSGYTYNISAATYFIQGVGYTSDPIDITLDPSDPLLDRIDTFIVNTSGVGAVLTGTPDLNPNSPSPDPSTELQVSIAIVTAGSVQPNIVQKIIYKENTGAPAEFAATTSNAGRLSVSSATTPITGAVGINATAAINDDVATFTDVLQDFSLYNTFIFNIKSKAAWNNDQRLAFTFYDDATQIGNTVYLNNGAFGFDSGNTATSQVIAIPLSFFGLTANFDRLKITVVAPTGSIGFFMDDILVADHILTSGNNTHFWVSNGADIYNSNLGNVGIGATPNALYKFDVNGDVRLGRTTGQKTFFGNGLQVDYSASSSRIYSSNRLHLQSNNAGDRVLLGTVGGNIPLNTKEVIVELGSVSGASGVKSGLFVRGTSLHNAGSEELNFCTVQPTFQQTGTPVGTIRGYYYNPIIATEILTEEIAWENTSGDIIHGNLAGVGTRMVTVDSVGKLSTSAIPSGGGGGGDLQDILDAGNSANNQPIILNGGKIYIDEAEALTIFGINAGYLSTGNNCIYVGDSSGINNSGDKATLIGDNTGASNNKNNLVAVGHSSGTSNTGQSGTFVGTNSGFENTGDDTVFFGENAGYQNTGDKVIGIGKNAANANAFNNVIIFGESYPTANNQISIPTANGFCTLRIDFGLLNTSRDFIAPNHNGYLQINDADYNTDIAGATNYQLTEAIIWELTDSVGGGSILLPDPTNLNGCELVLINKSDKNDILISNDNTYRPYLQGGSTRISDLKIGKMMILKAVNNKWRGGLLADS